MLGGAIVGFLSGLLQQMARDATAPSGPPPRPPSAAAGPGGARRRAAGLALVQRAAPSWGRDAVELGRLAGEQEVALRGLVQTQETSRAGAPLGERDPACC